MRIPYTQIAKDFQPLLVALCAKQRQENPHTITPSACIAYCPQTGQYAAFTADRASIVEGPEWIRARGYKKMRYHCGIFGTVIIGTPTKA